MTDVKAIFVPRLLGLIAQSKAFSSISHPTIKGRLREILITELFRPILPPTVVVGTGTIVSSFGDRTFRNQDDIIIFDRQRAPILLEGEEGIYPIEGVLMHMEVKSTLTAADIESAMHAAFELRELSSRESEASAGGIFAFESDAAIPEVERMKTALKRQTRWEISVGQAFFPIIFICVASKGLWMVGTLAGGQPGWYFIGPGESGVDHLLAVVANTSFAIYSRTGSGRTAPDYFMGNISPEMVSPEVLIRES